jgi:lipoprotein-releasing system permease protein
MPRFIELVLALKFLKPRRHYLSVITVISLLGVALGVMVLIVVLSVMRGFELRLREKVLGFNPHLTVTNYGILANYQELGDQIRKTIPVEGMTPFIIGPVLAECHGKISTPQIKAVPINDPDEEVIPLRDSLIKEGGQWLQGPETVVVGIEWAKRNNAWVGDKLLIHSPRNIALLKSQSENKGGEPESYYLPSEYTIVGIFQTDFYEYDIGYMMVELSEAQRLYNMHGASHGLAIKLDDPMRAFELGEKLKESLDAGTYVLTWVDLNKSLFAAVQTERRTMSILFFVVMLVAAFALMSTNLTVAVQKTREFGLLMALGARPWQLLLVVTLYGLMIGMSGCLLGLGAGAFLLSQRDAFSNWMAESFDLDVFPAEIYHFSGIPAVWDWGTVIWVLVFGVLLSVASGMVPAWVAARVQPAEALSHG